MLEEAILSWNVRLPNSLKQRNVTAITPFKVIQSHRFQYQSKAHIYDFLLVTNSNLPPVVNHLRVMVKFSLARGECLQVQVQVFIDTLAA